VSDADTSAAMQRLTSELLRPPFNQWLDLRPVSVDEAAREVVVSLSYRPEFSYDPDKALYHGGVVASLIDVAGYAAVAIWSDGPVPTAMLHIEYLAAAPAGDLVARGVVRKRGRALSRVDIEVMADGKLVALGRGTFAMEAGAP
jgi:uncharacterized protein (TIGR00369 family)